MSFRKELKIITGFCLVWLCFSLSGGAKIAAAQTRFLEEGRKNEQATREAFEAAALIVIGRMSRTDEIERWATVMFNNPAMKNQVIEGVKFPEAAAFIKSRRDLISERVKNAFIAIYGDPPRGQLAGEYLADYNAQKWWFATIYQNEKERLSTIPALRERMIRASFHRAMGRTADADEMTKWKPKTEVSREIVENLRVFLYSKEGGVELLAVVTRYIESLPKDKQANVNMNETIKQFKANKWIFADVAK